MLCRALRVMQQQSVRRAAEFICDLVCRRSQPGRREVVAVWEEPDLCRDRELSEGVRVERGEESVRGEV